MGIERLPRNKQRQSAKPSLRVDENTDCAISLPEENDAPSLWGHEHSGDIVHGRTVTIRGSAWAAKWSVLTGASRRDLAGARIIFYTNTVWQRENQCDSEP
jgi:hypothetical protein